MSERDENPLRPTGQPDAQLPAAGAPAPSPPDDVPPETAALAQLADRLGRVEEQQARFHQRSAHQELIIDRLHSENQLLRGGLNRSLLEPVITDLIRLHDHLSDEAQRLAASGQQAELTQSFAGDVEQILERCGIEMFSAEPGDPFDRSRHHALAVVACTDESQDSTVAEVIAAGFTERDTGKVRRYLQVRCYKYAPQPQ